MTALVTVQPPSKLEAFFAGFSRKNRVERRSPHSRSEFSMGERKLLHCEAMIPPLEGACSVTLKNARGKSRFTRDFPLAYCLNVVRTRKAV